MKTCALIPAYNEAAHIAQVVNGAKAHVDSVVVVDDGSTDETAELASRAGAVCLRNAANRGKGAVLRMGMKHALAGGFTHAVTLDGDGQHLPEDISKLLRVARETGADLVIGARTFDRSLMPRARYYSNTVGSRWASAMVGRKIHDSQSGFRVYKLERFRHIVLRSTRYEFEMEALIKMARSGAVIAHAPIQMVYDGNQPRSKMKPIRDTVRICFCSLAFRFLGA